MKESTCKNRHLHSSEILYFNRAETYPINSTQENFDDGGTCMRWEYSWRR